ncbi:MAG: N-acyl homoserine lactonase family protein [Pseudomonadota bacterium]
MQRFMFLIVSACWLAACSSVPGVGGAKDIVAAGGDPAAERGMSQVSLTVLDCGELRFDTVLAFGLRDEDTAVRQMFVPCYLIDHPSGKLLWDAGLPPAIVGQGWVPLQPGAEMRYAVGLVEQLASMQITPEEIDYIALSHHHFDHAGSANMFSASTLLVQRPEYVAAYENASANPVFDYTLYNELANAPRQLLDGDHDVFGDDSVRILNLPGHTPGHQALHVRLAETGDLVLSGDLYHFRASRRLRSVPEFNTDSAQTLASMARLEAYLQTHGATLWIQHDQALAETLRLAPHAYF